MVDKNKVLNMTKTLLKNVNINDALLSTVYDIVFAKLLQHTQAIDGLKTITFTATAAQSVAFISKRYTPLKTVRANGEDCEILSAEDGTILVPETRLNKKANYEVTYGYDEELQNVEAVLAEMVAEFFTKYNKELIGLDTKTNGFEVANLAEKYIWTEWRLWLEQLAQYVVDKKHEVGTLI